MQRGRRRVQATLAGVVAVAVLASVAVGIVERRRRVTAAAEREDRQDGEKAPARPGSGGTGGGGLLSALLGALSGDGDPAGGAAAGALLEDCASALGTAAPGGPAGLFAGPEKQSPDASEQLRSVAAAVEQVRGLRFRRVPDPVYVTPAEMSRRVQEQVSDQLTPQSTADEGRALVVLGALPPGADLKALTLSALGEQVAGYYDPATGELVVGRAGTSGPLDGQSRIVAAHELDHALVDQALGLPVDDTVPPPGTEDAALARLALVEGDATLAMQLYALAHVSLLEQLRGLRGALASQDQLARLPHHLQRNLTFAYLAGLSFICSLHAAEGWPGVDRAYKTPPTTTAQVLFPERYRSGEAAVDPRDPAAPGGSWTAAPPRALGAAELGWLLEAPGGDKTRALDRPAERAAAWAGGELQVWTDGDQTAAGLALVRRNEERSLCATATAWYAAAFPGGRRMGRQPGEALAVDGPRQDAVVRCVGADVRVGIAPDLATARTVAQ